MNLKPKCAVCKKELAEKYRQVLMIGSQGYRRYALCEGCAARTEKSQKAEGRRQKCERQVCDG